MSYVSHALKLVPVFLVCGLFPASTAHSQHSSIGWSTFGAGSAQSAFGTYQIGSSAGETAVGEISAANVVIESGFFPGYLYANGISSSLELSANAGWNMISIPFIMDQYRKTDLFPTAITRAYAYDGTIGAYRIYDTLQTGKGYWVKFASPAGVLLSGLTFRHDTISVTDKWNMIAPGSWALSASNVAALDSVTMATNFYGYFSAPSPGYRVVDTLEPGKAYWIKVHNPGRIVLKQAGPAASGGPASADSKPGSSASPATAILGKMNQLVIRDSAGQTGALYFAATPTDIDLNKWELPPALPAAEVMDVRFATGRMLESADQKSAREVGIQISSARYPLSISWQMTNPSDRAALRIGINDLPISGSGSIQITQASSTLALELQGKLEMELPKQFALRQNYPNPFNPSTTIRYDLPVKSNVRLTVYNILGQEVISLVDGIQEAGFKSVQWDGISASSGVYFYRISVNGIDDARQFVGTGKMILVK